MSIALLSIGAIIFIFMNAVIETLPLINKFGLILAPAFTLAVGAMAMSEANEKEK